MARKRVRKRDTEPMVNDMMQWTGRHQSLTCVAALLLLSSCGTTPGEKLNNADVPPMESPTTAAVEDVERESQSPTEEAVVAEPSQEQVWAANYDASRVSYVTAIAAALALRPKNIDVPSGSLDACRSLAKERDLDRRVAQAQKSFSLTRAATYDQALAALGAATITICPEFADIHQAQSAERAKRLRVEDRRRREREQRRADREAREAEEQAEQEYVSYENCTAVESAGAAPIYAGDPGYSRDLDRDGDGVACEQ